MRDMSAQADFFGRVISGAEVWQRAQMHQAVSSCEGIGPWTTFSLAFPKPRIPQ